MADDSFKMMKVLTLSLVLLILPTSLSNNILKVLTRRFLHPRKPRRMKKKKINRFNCVPAAPQSSTEEPSAI